jgi:hypothetical protein
VPQSWSGRCEEEKNLDMPGIEPGPYSPWLVAIPTELSLLTCFAYSLKLNIEAACSSRTSVNLCQTTWLHIPEDSTLHSNLL